VEKKIDVILKLKIQKPTKINKNQQKTENLKTQENDVLETIFR